MDHPAISLDTEHSESPADRVEETRPDPVNHLIVLIHGIRTHASWAEMVAAVLEGPKGIKAIPIRYPFFDVFRFLCPFLTRRRPIERIIRELRDLRAENPVAKISVIAHSFGTYALIRALAQREIRVHRVILCGCIIPEGFRKADYGGQLGPDPILNDCGTHDIWPVLARCMTWGYGSTGTFGLGTVGVRDRFNKFGHGDYFNKAFVEKYWAPFLLDGRILPTEWEKTRKTPPWWLSFLNWLPLKYVGVALALALGIYSWIWMRGPQEVQLDFGPDVNIGHYMGVPAFSSPLRVRNTTSREALVENLQLTLISPTGRETPMKMEAIWIANQSSPPLSFLTARPKETAELLYSFFNSNDGFVLLQQEVSNFGVRANLVAPTPDETKELLPKEMVDRIFAFAKSQFIWEAGEWQVRVTAHQGSKRFSVDKYFTVTSDENARMWNITDHYGSGIGVFPMWRGLTLGNYQPYLQKRLRDSR